MFHADLECDGSIALDGHLGVDFADAHLVARGDVDIVAAKGAVRLGHVEARQTKTSSQDLTFSKHDQASIAGWRRVAAGTRRLNQLGALGFQGGKGDTIHEFSHTDGMTVGDVEVVGNGKFIIRPTVSNKNAKLTFTGEVKLVGKRFDFSAGEIEFNVRLKFTPLSGVGVIVPRSEFLSCQSVVSTFSAEFSI